MDMIECVTFYGDTTFLPKERLSFRPAVYGLIQKEDTILLVKNRNNGRYTLPGGGVEVGEQMEDALKREIKEETGIAVDVEGFLAFRERFFYYDPEDLAFHGLCFFSQCKPLSFDLIDDDKIEDDEASKPRWISVACLQPEEFQHSGDLILKYARH